jgi:hypothetical protein
MFSGILGNKLFSSVIVNLYPGIIILQFENQSSVALPFNFQQLQFENQSNTF